MPLERLLFASCHGYIDPSNGAATATSDVLELLADRGVDCRVLSTGVLDYHVETPLEPLLAACGVPVERCDALLPSGAVRVFDLTVRGVRVMLLPTVSSRIERSPNPNESAAFLSLAEQVFDQFQPQVMLTYGGHPANLELMRRARSRGIAVVFHLHNFAYTDRSAFRDASAVLVPTEYCRRYYADRIGLASVMIPNPFHRARVLVDNPEPRYLTFVNPVPEKGVSVVARIALELGRRRPDIPVLIVEGRGTTDWFARLNIDLSELTNLHRMENTADPRAFYRVSRAVLMPSVWLENGGLVARESLANGLPVLASDRGGLPETLGDAGFLFTIPSRITPRSLAVPTAREVAPWVATVERLWDDPAWETKHRRLALAAAEQWNPDRLTADYERFFSALADHHLASVITGDF